MRRAAEDGGHAGALDAVGKRCRDAAGRSSALRTGTQGQRRAFTLTKVAILLGIMGLILGGIWTAAAQVYKEKSYGDNFI